MVLVWRGFGFVVPLVAFVMLLVSQFAIDGVLGDDYYTSHGWPKLAGCTASALVLLGLGAWMNGGVRGGRHSFFFLPVQYWSAINFAFGFILMF